MNMNVDMKTGMNAGMSASTKAGMITKPDFFTVIRERHSVRKYDASYRMSEEQIRSLMRAAAAAPSAWNLQHWKFLIIENQAHKNILYGIANEQQQVVEASIVVAVLGDLQANLNAENVLARDVEAGRMPPEIKASLITQVENAYADSPVWARDQAVSNASLAAMQLMLAAKAMGLDTCPMVGFDPDRLIEAFEIPDRYVPVMLISVGKAAEPARPSERLPVEDTIIWNRFG